MSQTTTSISFRNAAMLVTMTNAENRTYSGDDCDIRLLRISTWVETVIDLTGTRVPVAGQVFLRNAESSAPVWTGSSWVVPDLHLQVGFSTNNYPILIKNGSAMIVPLHEDTTQLFVKAIANEGAALGFTVISGDDLLVSDILGHGLAVGDIIRVESTDTLPSPLDNLDEYYVVSVDGQNIQISETPGGAAIDITNGGSGTHSFFKINPISVCIGIQPA